MTTLITAVKETRFALTSRIFILLSRISTFGHLGAL